MSSFTIASFLRSFLPSYHSGSVRPYIQHVSPTRKALGIIAWCAIPALFVVLTYLVDYLWAKANLPAQDVWPHVLEGIGSDWLLIGLCVLALFAPLFLSQRVREGWIAFKSQKNFC